MTATFLYGFFALIFTIAALIIGFDVYERSKRNKVRVIVNVRPPMLYDEYHIDRPAYERREKEANKS